MRFAEVVRIGSKKRVRWVGDYSSMPEHDPEAIQFFDLTGLIPEPEEGWTLTGGVLVEDLSSMVSHIPKRGLDLLHKLPDSAIETITGASFAVGSPEDRRILTRIQAFFQQESIRRDDPRLDTNLQTLVDMGIITAQNKLDVIGT